jgi:hypothetical protein
VCAPFILVLCLISHVCAYKCFGRKYKVRFSYLLRSFGTELLVVVLRTCDQRLPVSGTNNAATLEFRRVCFQHPSYYIANDESANNVIFHVIDYPFQPVGDVEIDK